jgi:hypothetical protein
VWGSETNACGQRIGLDCFAHSKRPSGISVILFRPATPQIRVIKFLEGRRMTYAAVATVGLESSPAPFWRDIQRYPLLEQQEEYALAKRWRERGDREAADKLITSHLRLVAKIAMGYRDYGLPISARSPLYVDVAIRRWERTAKIPARHAESNLTFAEIAAQRGVAASGAPAERRAI